MRWTWVVLLGTVLAGCAGRSTRDLQAPVQETPSRIGCPEGTTEIGDPPPASSEMWCARTSVTGSVERHGPIHTWWADGTPKEVGAFAAGQRTGHWWFWNAEGQLEREGDFSEGVESGYWLVYGPDGAVLEEGPMKSGGREGTWVVRVPGSPIPTEGLYVGGEREGVWVEHDAQGRPQTERVYRRGRLISQREL